MIVHFLEFLSILCNVQDKIIIIIINCTLIVLDMLLRLTSTVCSFLKSICVFVCVFNCIFDSYVYSSPHHSMVYKSSSNNITIYCNINKRYEASGVLAIGCMIYCFVNLLPGISSFYRRHGRKAALKILSRRLFNSKSMFGWLINI